MSEEVERGDWFFFFSIPVVSEEGKIIDALLPSRPSLYDKTMG